MIIDPTHPIAELLSQDLRYKLEAYAFVFEALSYAQSVLHLGTPSRSEPLQGQAQEHGQPQQKEEPAPHVTGQQLCGAIRQLALEQFGYMAKTVLNSWGLYGTGDFGEIVFNLIRVGQMRKTARDRREDFDDVYDFDAAFRQQFRFQPSE